MLRLLDSGRRVINIDETWFNETDFRKMKWRLRGETNSAPLHSMTPRVSAIVAMDTDGRIYFALTQVNTDTDVFLLFLKRLHDKLTTEDRHWKQHTVLQVDGATYHKSE